MMFSRTSSALRQGIQRSAPVAQKQTVRKMAGGAHFMTVSKQHTMWGEAFGTVCWVWIFHRARIDGPVVLGWRHPWEHAPDPFNPHGHGHADHAEHAEAGAAREESWDSFTAKAMIQREVDDDDDDDEDEDEE